MIVTVAIAAICTLAKQATPSTIISEIRMELLQRKLTRDYTSYKASIEVARLDWRTLYPESTPAPIFDVFPTDGSIFGWEGLAYDEADHLQAPRPNWSPEVQTQATRLGLDCASAKQLITPDGEAHWYAVQAGC